jgi:hypothetical protein
MAAIVFSGVSMANFLQKLFSRVIDFSFEQNRGQPSALVSTAKRRPVARSIS